MSMVLSIKIKKEACAARQTYTDLQRDGDS